MNAYSSVNKVLPNRCYRGSNTSSLPGGPLGGTHRPHCLARDVIVVPTGAVRSHEAATEWNSEPGAENID